MEDMDRQERIEQYLAGRLSPEEASRFEEEMSANPELAREVAVHRDLQQAFGDRRRQEMLKTLSELDAEFETAPIVRPIWQRPALWVSVAAAVIVLVLFFQRNQDEQDTEPLARQEEPLPPSDTTRTERPVPQEPAPQPGQAPTTEPEIPEESMIAQVDPERLARNPFLDDLANQQIRSETQWLLANLSFSNQQVIVTLAAEDLDSQEGWFIKLFSNDTDAYLNDEPLTRQAITWTNADSGGFTSMVRIPFRQNPGLFYGVVYSTDDGEPVWVGKFLIE